MYTVDKRIREITGNVTVFDYMLLNDFKVVVGIFHNEMLACKVRDLLNKEEKI